MRMGVLALCVVVFTSACSTATARETAGRTGDVIWEDEGERSRQEGGDVYARSPGEVPRGHYPPPGECRIWYSDRPPGHQPPPARCESLVGRVPLGAFLLYNGRAWDTEHDWEREASRRPGSVPNIILRIMNSLVE